MLFLWGCLIPLAGWACAYLATFFWKSHHGVSIDHRSLAWAFLANGGASLLLSLIYCLSVQFLFQDYSLLNAVGGLLALTLASFYWNPRQFYFSTQETGGPFRQGKWLWSVPRLLSFFGFVAEVYLCNLNSYRASPIPSVFSFSTLRFLAFTLFVVALFQIPRLLQNPCQTPLSSLSKVWKILGIGALIYLGCFLLIAGIFHERYFTSYPFASSEVDQGNPFLYYNLFSAFLHGQLSLEQIPPSALTALANPYDPASRSGISYLWDTAYYQGHYYCYYGPAPLILVMFPVYFLSGCTLVPTGLFLEVAGLGIYVFAFAALSLLLVEFFHNGWDVRLWTFLILSAIFSSLALSFIAYRESDWKYRLPFIYGLAFSFAFLACILRARLSGKRRMLSLGGAAFFYVSVMASRPDFGLIVLPALPFLIGILKQGRGARKKMALDFLPFVLLLGIGAGLLMSYNYLRFGSVLEFGSSYQLTVADARSIKLTAGGFAASFLHYWICPPSFKAGLFFVDVGTISSSWDTNLYNAGSIGWLFQPFFYGIFLIPIAWKAAKTWEERLFYLLLALVPFILMGTTNSLAGSCYRYLLAVWPFLALLSLAVLLRVAPIAAATPYYRGFLIAVFIIGVIGIYLGFDLTFNGFDGYQHGTLGFFGEWIEEAFSF